MWQQHWGLKWPVFFDDFFLKALKMSFVAVQKACDNISYLPHLLFVNNDEIYFVRWISAGSKSKNAWKDRWNRSRLEQLVVALRWTGPEWMEHMPSPRGQGRLQRLLGVLSPASSSHYGPCSHVWSILMVHFGETGLNLHHDLIFKRNEGFQKISE